MTSVADETRSGDFQEVIRIDAERLKRTRRRTRENSQRTRRHSGFACWFCLAPSGCCWQLRRRWGGRQGSRTGHGGCVWYDGGTVREATRTRAIRPGPLSAAQETAVGGQRSDQARMVSMVSHARRKLLGDPRQAVYHCWNRCVRRAFLCGRDPHTRKDYSHRRGWIMGREEQLAGLFAIDLEFRAELSNHLHLVLRTMPRVARRWTAEEVVRRWLTATRLAKCLTDEVPDPPADRVAELAKDKQLVARLRRRLSRISWFMGILCENVARRANQEDGCKGRFFESRFSCRQCTDVNEILLHGIYVDLNVYRAGEVDDPLGSPHTSIYQRLQAHVQRKRAGNRPDGWVGELTLRPERKGDDALADGSRTGRRASDLGLLPITLSGYVQLLRWTAGQLRSGQRDTLPADLMTVLDHFQVQPDHWLDTVAGYESTFGHAVGRAGTLSAVAKRMELQHLHGIAGCRRAFT